MEGEQYQDQQAVYSQSSEEERDKIESFISGMHLKPIDPEEQREYYQRQETEDNTIQKQSQNIREQQESSKLNQIQPEEEQLRQDQENNEDPTLTTKQVESAVIEIQVQNASQFHVQAPQEAVQQEQVNHLHNQSSQNNQSTMVFQGEAEVDNFIEQPSQKINTKSTLAQASEINNQIQSTIPQNNQQSQGLINITGTKQAIPSQSLQNQNNFHKVEDEDEINNQFYYKNQPQKYYESISASFKQELPQVKQQQIVSQKPKTIQKSSLPQQKTTKQMKKEQFSAFKANSQNQFQIESIKPQAEKESGGNAENCKCSIM